MRFDTDYRTITISKRKYHYGPRLHTQLLLALLSLWNVLKPSATCIPWPPPIWVANKARLGVLAFLAGVLLSVILEQLAAGYIDRAIGV